VVGLIGLVLGSIYVGIATATEAAALGVVGALALSAIQGSMSWKVFRESLLGATRLYCMIAFILAGAAFLTLAMQALVLRRTDAIGVAGGEARMRVVQRLVGAGVASATGMIPLSELDRRALGEGRLGILHVTAEAPLGRLGVLERAMR
jgi:hypothetical protein